MFPKKLSPGDEVRVIAPARSLGMIKPLEDSTLAAQRFEEMGLRLGFSEHVWEIDEFDSSSIASRVSDLHAAFSDANAKGVLTVIGGFNSNQLLKYLDYELIKKNPKILCGYSDITALANAIYAKTGLVTYSGPHYSTFRMKRGLAYTQAHFQKCLMSDEPFEVFASNEWSDDPWFLDQEKREFMPNEGFACVQPGEASGTIIGGNICTLRLLQGTRFMPSLDDSILFLEDDELTFPAQFDRDLQSLIHLPEFEGVLGIAIGRFQKKSKFTQEHLERIIKTKNELEGLPVISGVDFGHTTPMITFPIGGKSRISAEKSAVKLEIINH